ncbi:group II truncated hemoglobin [Chitinophaga sp. Hz27]|uniref:group II truncated hemoglobin n=1 Tax=Chitinophaga sp. Hz27 TaxID=3347169 RepID=UPI0035DF0F61
MAKEIKSTAEEKVIPTLYEWVGGMQVFEKLTAVFYEKVLQDELLAPVFRHMSSQHQLHVAHFIAEVFGGPKTYSHEEGSHYEMIRKHMGRHLTEQHRKRWVALLLEIVDEICLPDDPEFRSAFVGYIEWGTRLAVMNSNSDDIKEGEHVPMPKWGWGETEGPYIQD